MSFLPAKDAELMVTKAVGVDVLKKPYYMSLVRSRGKGLDKIGSYAALLTIDGNKYAPGVYLMNIDFDKGSASTKVVIK